MLLSSICQKKAPTRLKVTRRAPDPNSLDIIGQRLPAHIARCQQPGKQEHGLTMKLP